MPLDWEEEFSASGELHVEIGFGNGEYLVRQAREHPERCFVGIEERWASVIRGLRRIRQGHLDNARVIQEDAHVAVERLFAARSIHEMISLFPCPWHKEKAEHHRLFTTGFLRVAARRLRDGGKLWIVTDYRPLLDWTLEQNVETGFRAHWEIVRSGFDTKYERKWHARGQRQFYRLTLEKEEHRPGKDDAGEVALETLRVPRFDPFRFEPPVLRGDIALEPKGFLFDPERQEGMLRIVLVEDHLTQHLWIRITRRGEEWAIQPALGCSYYPTAGVRAALHAVRDAVRGQDETDG
jgi:tRNA (guanine-N7-)-methyltransferase